MPSSNKESNEPDEILRTTLLRLRTAYQSVEEVDAIYLGRYFTVAVTKGGSVGAAMSTYRGTNEELRCIQDRLSQHVVTGPFDSACCISELTIPGEGSHVNSVLLQSSVCNAVVSALSQPYLTNVRTFEHGYRCSTQRPSLFAGEYERVLVVGYGGLLDELATSISVQTLNVVDLDYCRRAAVIEEHLEVYRKRFPQKRFIASSSLEGGEVFDLMSVTGSTLANNTLRSFLNIKSKHTKFILQGQSASIVPDVLFEEGVDLVMTTLKPSALVHAAKSSFDGSALRPYLEGGLPWMYLEPFSTGRRD